jgi:hypothetical protein
MNQMHTGESSKNILACIRAAMRDFDPNTPLGQAVARLKQPFVIGDGTKWYYEGFIGFISLFSAVRQAVAALDDSVSPELPPFLLDPATIARMFRIPQEDFNWHGQNDSDATAAAVLGLENKTQEACERLSKIQGNLTALVQRHTVKEFYSTDDLCRMFGKAPYTVREWCRLGRIRAKKVPASRGGELEWRIPHEELVRFQNEGLLPIRPEY